MLTAIEITRSVYGAWRLAHADPAGMQFFDTTVEGFWRSFRLAPLVLPAYLLMLWIGRTTMTVGIGAPAAGSWIAITAIDVIAYAISWLAFPLAAYYLAETLDREREYFGYIVAFNWSSAVVQVGVSLPVAAITGLSLLPPPVDVLLQFGVVAALLAYSWFIAKTALRIGGLAAGGLVVLEVLISLLISGVSDAMVR